MSERYPLSWPEGRIRTPGGARGPNNTWKQTFGRIRTDLFNELRMLGAKDVILSTNIPVSVVSGMPREDRQNVNDPGVAVYFTRRKFVLEGFEGRGRLGRYVDQRLCFACDTYDEVRLNMKAIAMTIEGIRQVERCGASDMMERAFMGFAALPERAGGRGWKEILGFPTPMNISAGLVKDRFRDLLKQTEHATGGDRDKVEELIWARDAALRQLGEKT